MSHATGYSRCMFTRTTLLMATGLLLASMTLNAALIIAVAWPLRWLWNTTLPQLFHLPSIDYLLAVRLMLLWVVLRVAAKGAKFSAKFRKSI